MTNFMQDDECCSPRFQAAALEGSITGDTWTCEECGSTWKAHQITSTAREWRCSDAAFTITRVRG